MDQKIAKYKRILNFNLYALASESENFEGFIIRIAKRRLHKKHVCDQHERNRNRQKRDHNN